MAQLTEQSWDELQHTSSLLVNFHAPWCGHCRELKTEYADAAQALKETLPSVVLAECDATRGGAQLARRQGVDAYPTLKWFRSGVASDYTGGGTTAEIVRWVTKQAGQAVLPLVDEAAIAALLAQGPALIGYFAAGADEAAASLREAFAAAAQRGADGVSFGEVADPSLFGPHQGGSLAMFSSAEGPGAAYDGAAEPEDVVAFVSVESLPPYLLFTEANMPKIFALSGKRLRHVMVFAMLDGDGARSAIARAATDAYPAYKGSAINVVVDASRAEAEQVMAFFDIALDQLPAVRGFDQELNRRYAPSGAVDVTSSESYVTFAKEFIGGALRPVLMSQPAAPGGVGASPVATVVGSTFEQVVTYSSANVLLVVYAPWCAHCKKLAPILEELGEHFADDGSVVIAKLDGTVNEVEGLTVDGYPTLRFYPAGVGSAAQEYMGERDLRGMIAFIQANSQTGKGELSKGEL